MLRHKERGASLVEAALVLPLLFMLVFGIWQIGRAYNTYISLTHASREAARYGATLRSSDDCLPTAANFMDCVAERAKTRSYPVTLVDNADNNLGLRTNPTAVDDDDICIWKGSTAADGTPIGMTGNNPCLGGGDDPTHEARVQVTISKKIEINMLFWSTEITLRARGVSRDEVG